MSVTLYQLELRQSVVNCGMSYVFRLADGSFFLIDGGYFTEGEADELFAFLKASGGEKPVIRGWLFTHAHQDHIGCFMDFVLRHLEEVVIEGLYYNFQPVDLSKAKGDPRKKSNDIATVREFYGILENRCGDLPVTKLRTGDVLRFGELELEVLYTADDILPLETSFNDYSCVTKATVGGQSVLFLGDVQENGSAWLLEHQKDKLKSDFVQAAHHGFNGATEELYRAIGANVALFPCPDFEFEKNRTGSVNSCILSLAKEYYVSGYGTDEFTFPYQPGSAKVHEKRYFDVPEQPLREKLKTVFRRKKKD